LFPSSGSFPSVTARSASTSPFSRPARRLLALQPAHSRSHLMTLSIGGFRQVVTFPPAPIATGWSDPCRKGLAPSQELCLSTAHDYITIIVGFKFSVHTGAFLDDQRLKPAPACAVRRPVCIRPSCASWSQ